MVPVLYDVADLQGVVAAITGQITAIMPIGLSIMGALLGVKLVPKLIKRFL